MWTPDGMSALVLERHPPAHLAWTGLDQTPSGPKLATRDGDCHLYKKPSVKGDPTASHGQPHLLSSDTSPHVLSTHYVPGPVQGRGQRMEQARPLLEELSVGKQTVPPWLLLN